MSQSSQASFRVKKEQLTGGEKKSLILLALVIIIGSPFLYQFINTPTLTVPPPVDAVLRATGMDRFLPRPVLNTVSYTKFKNPFNDNSVNGQSDQLSVSSIQTKNDLQKIDHDVDSTDLGSMDTEYKQLENSAAK